MRDEDSILELAYGAGIKGTIYAVLDAAFLSKKFLAFLLILAFAVFSFGWHL